MGLDSTRAQVLTIWIGALIVSVGTFVVAAATRYAGLTFENIGVPIRDLFAAVSPSLVVLVGAYYVADKQPVRLTKGQRAVALGVTIAYAGTLIFISAAMLFLDGFGLNQDAAPPHPAINHYVVLTQLQPLVLAPLFFLFGRASGNKAA